MKLRGDKIISYTSRINAFPHKQKIEQTDHIADAFSDAKFLDWKNPSWNDGGHVHNWHNYSTPALELIWNSFNDDQKRIIAVALDRVASQEHWD